MNLTSMSCFLCNLIGFPLWPGKSYQWTSQKWPFLPFWPFQPFGNGHMGHQHGHTMYPVKQHTKSSSVVLDSYQSDLLFRQY